MGKVILDKDELFIMTAKDLSVKYNTTRGAVYHARKKFNNPYVKINNSGTEMMLNIDSPNKAYILGLFLADSSVSEYYISLILHQKDRDVLEKIHNYLKLTTPIIDRVIKRSGFDNKFFHQSCLAIYSKILCKAVSKYGLVPNKTHQTFFPDIHPSLYSHFIRGYFDGDGCIHVDKFNHLRIKIIGNIDLITKMQAILVNDCNISNTKIMRCNNSKINIVNLQHGGNKKCLKILDYLYRDADIYINRKFEVYKNFKNKYNVNIFA